MSTTATITTGAGSADPAVRLASTAPGRRLPRLVKVVAMALLVASLAGAVSVEPAGAALLSVSGTVGVVNLPQGKCTYFPSWKRLDVTVAPPTIYAPDLHAGGGNDSAWVRYQVYVIDSSNRMAASSGLSAWVAAYDNKPAAFTGASTAFTAIPNYGTVWIGVEWYGFGHAIYKLDSYQQYVSGLTYPYGPTNSCSKYTPPGYVSW